MRSVSVSPHVRSGASTATIMRDVAIALTPSLVFGVFVFGLRALVIICLSIVTCLLTEYLWQRLMKLPVTVADGSALVTGMILAVNLPASVPWWIPVMGGVFAILVVKQLFGGIGQNIMNPALAARCFLVISFPALLGSRMPAVGQIFGSDMWAGFGQRMSTMAVDAATTPTPLALLRSGEAIDLLQAFLGARSGCIGEVCAPAILLGAVYMLARGVISLHITGHLPGQHGRLCVFAQSAGRRRHYAADNACRAYAHRGPAHRCGVHGLGLYHQPHHPARAGGLRYPARLPDRAVPGVRYFGGGRVLRHYHR